MDILEKEKAFVSFVEGKRIALVGPAASLVGQGLGKKIDSYDIVVRIKSFDAGDIEDAGDRCDILYQTNPYDRCDVIEKKEKKIFEQYSSYIFERYEDPIKEYKAKGIQWLCSCYPKQEWFAKNFIDDWESLGDKIQWRYLHPYMYKEMKDKIPTGRPNSGFATFLDLCSVDYEELFICGLDFYRSMYKPNYQNSLVTEDLVHRWTMHDHNNVTHNQMEAHYPDAQYDHFKKIIEASRHFGKKITVDPWFEEIMKNPEYDSLYEKNSDLQQEILLRWENDPEMNVTTTENSDWTRAIHSTKRLLGEKE